MKVTITIEGVNSAKEIVELVEEALFCGYLESDDGELYRGHRQFSVGGYNMTYTSEETTN